jgi:phosphonate transport system substrate-binding protein
MNKKTILIAFTLLTAVILVVLLSRNKLLDIALEHQIQVAQETDKEGTAVRFGVVSRYAPRKLFQGYQPMMDYLSTKTGYNFELKISSSYDETVRQLVEGEVEFASLGNYTYIISHSAFGVRCIAAPLNVAGEPKFHSAIVVRDDSPIKNLVDVNKRSIAFASELSMSYWMSLYLLQNAGVSQPGKSAHFDHHEDVVQKVLRGEFEVGSVKDVVAQRYLDQGLRIITMSPEIPAVPIAVAESADAKLVELVTTALLEITPDSTQNWDQEFSHGFALVDDSDYNSMREILRALGHNPMSWSEVTE